MYLNHPRKYFDCDVHSPITFHNHAAIQKVYTRNIRRHEICERMQYSINFGYYFIPGEIKPTSKVESLPANSLIGVTGVTVMDVVVQKGNPEALSSSLVTEIAVSVVL